MRPKYKVGDRVRAKRDFTEFEIKKGGIYKIKGEFFGSYTLSGTTGTYGLYDEYWERVETKAEPFADKEYEEIFI